MNAYVAPSGYYSVAEVAAARGTSRQAAFNWLTRNGGEHLVRNGRFGVISKAAYGRIATSVDSRACHAATVAPNIAKIKTYFIRCAATGHIKIGQSKHPEKRLLDLQVGTPSELQLLATVPASTVSEEECHVRFTSDRIRGEWFAPSKALLALIEGFGGSR